MNRFKVIICGRDAEEWARDCLESVFEQEDTRFDVYIRVDPSEDRTAMICESYVSMDKIIEICESYFMDEVDHSYKDRLLTYNYERKGALYNQWEAILDSKPDDDDVIVFVDLDDKLIDNTVLTYLRNIYDTEDCLLTYGNYITNPYSDTCHIPTRYPSYVEEENSYRENAYKVGMRYGHLRTVKYEVLKHLSIEDFLDRNGEWFKTACDSAIMLPALELAGGRYKCIDKPLYVYNSENPLSEWRVRPRQIDSDHYDILTKKKKEPLYV